MLRVLKALIELNVPFVIIIAAGSVLIGFAEGWGDAAKAAIVFLVVINGSLIWAGRKVFYRMLFPEIIDRNE